MIFNGDPVQLLHANRIANRLKKKSNGVNLQSVFQFYTKLPKHEPWLIVDYHLLYIVHTCI